MSDQVKVLLLGGTGRTGGRVLRQLLDRGVRVRAIVRSSSRLPEGVLGNERLEAIEADLYAMSDEDLRGYTAGCDSIISCLGHTTSTLQGIFVPPRDLVTRAVRRSCKAVRDLRPDAPVKLVLMSSVSVNTRGAADARRGVFEKALIWLLRGLVPPATDNQGAADFLFEKIGPSDPAIEWVVVRPDSLVEGDVSEYSAHEGLITGIFKPKTTAMANVAHFMCDLVTNQQAWEAWRGKVPVIVNTVSAQ